MHDDHKQALIRLAATFQCVFGAVAFAALLAAGIVFANMWALGLALFGVLMTVLAQQRAVAVLVDVRQPSPAMSTFMKLWWAGIALAALSFIALAIGA